MIIDFSRAVSLLHDNDNFIILTHANPDGDTLGAGVALLCALRKLGKKARVINADEIPAKYGYLYEGVDFPEFKEEFIVAVDVATENLLGPLQDEFKGKINLCIDHHSTNTDYLFE